MSVECLVSLSSSKTISAETSPISTFDFDPLSLFIASLFLQASFPQCLDCLFICFFFTFSQHSYDGISDFLYHLALSCCFRCQRLLLSPGDLFRFYSSFFLSEYISRVFAFWGRHMQTLVAYEVAVDVCWYSHRFLWSIYSRSDEVSVGWWVRDLRFEEVVCRAARWSDKGSRATDAVDYDASPRTDDLSAEENPCHAKGLLRKTFDFHKELLSKTTSKPLLPSAAITLTVEEENRYRRSVVLSSLADFTASLDATALLR